MLLVDFQRSSRRKTKPCCSKSKVKPLKLWRILKIVFVFIPTLSNTITAIRLSLLTHYILISQFFLQYTI